jgi:hypothetical protein
MQVSLHRAAREELGTLRRRSLEEYTAMLTAFDKLALGGPELAYPHSSKVYGTKLRELRPRAGRSPWRAFFWRVGDVLVVGAIGPEAVHDPRGFKRAVRTALARLQGN